MENLKFGDKVLTNSGKEAVVQEDQEVNSNEVKIIYEGEDTAHIVNIDELKRMD